MANEIFPPANTIFFLIIVILTILAFIYVKNHYPKPLPTYILLGIVLSFSAFVGISSLHSYIDGQNKVYKNYLNGNYKVVEGEIEDFHAMPKEEHDSESFYVSHVYFYYPDFTGYGYSTCKKDGGYITGNGQKVRISYITYLDQNLILKLEIENK